MAQESADPIVPDTKDWTWSTRARCPECGFDASSVSAEDLPGAVAPLTEPWAAVLTAPGVRERPVPTTWSHLEYACHVRDVLGVFTERFELALEQEHPTLPNWDQDRAAIEGQYAAQDPVEVGRQIPERAAALVDVLQRFRGDDWDRPVTRSDGAQFTALSLGRYLLHDLAHHLVDVGETVPGR
jgi:hypothetical protein